MHPIQALTPAKEQERLNALREYEVLDTDHELAFDDLAELASYICGTPISAISLVDNDRQWFKASVGLSDRETPRDISFCQHAILEEEMLVVPNAAEDERFKDSPLVTDGPKVQFYAGVPLVTPSGDAIGALCVKDTMPRNLTEEQRDALKRLARQVVGQLELRKKNRSLEHQSLLLEGHALDLQQAIRQAVQAENESKVALEELRKGEDRFQLVCRATKDVVWDMDLLAGTAWLSKNYGDIYLTNSGSTNPTLKEWIDGIHPEDRERVSSSFDDALKSGVCSWQCEYRLSKTAGGYAEVLDRAFVIFDEQGTAVRIIGAISDQTERMQAEKNREEKENAERANLAKSQFLSRMSHELRTPLNSILGFAQLLEMYQPTDQQKECIGRILTGGKHLLGLINEVLDLSRIESGNIEISREPVKIVHVVDEAISLTQPLARNSGIAVSKDDDANLELFAMADRQRLLQIVINLISNGIKYNAAAGSVHIGIQAVSEESVRITVRDTGMGIGEKLAHRVFMPFDRLGIEQQMGIEGTGLGLALSKSLVDAMGGEISFASTLGQGTTFTVDLEAAIAPEIEEGILAKVANAPIADKVVNILYVEDNESNIALMENVLLTRPNWRLKVALNGTEGLELASRNRPDLVLLDLDLPDFSGYEVLLQLRADPSLQQAPILIVSADATKERVDKLLAAGANGYITKPFDVRDLLNQISLQVSGEVRLAA